MQQFNVNLDVMAAQLHHFSASLIYLSVQIKVKHRKATQ